MPPKKKKSGKKKGKKGGKKSAPPVAKTEEVSELTKEYYLVQIRDLENRLARYQRKCDELEVMNGQYQGKYNRMARDQKDMEQFLKKSLDQRADENADLNDRILGLQQAKDAEKEMFEQQLQQVRTEFQETKDQLTSENMILGGKLASLEEFKVQKEDLMAKFAAMEDKLKKQEEDHKEVIYNLERKQVVDKDRLKKEMVMRVNQVASEFRKVSNKQMAETTKRTIRENVSINAQLAKMSDKTMELIQENDESKSKEKKQRQIVDMLEANEKELAKKNHSNQKVIRMLTEKCKDQETMISEYELREQEYQEIEAEAELLKQQMEATRDEIQTLSQQNEQYDEDLNTTRKLLEDEQVKNKKLEKVLSDAAISLKQALVARTEEDAEESPYDVVEKRDNMLENMLVILNSAAAICVGPSPSQFQKRDTREKSASKMPGSGKGIRKGDLPPSPLGRAPAEIPHYKLGDLGLIPRPSQNIPTSFDKMKELSNTTRLASKKAATKSVGVQTISTSKAAFYADQLLSKVPQNAHLVQELQASMEKEGTFPPIASIKKVMEHVHPVASLEHVHPVASLTAVW